MSRLQIPSYINELLQKAPYSFAITEAIDDFVEWFRESKMPFFPDYTDHTSKHLEEVLESLELLIPQEARKYFSPSDAAIVVLAVLFHDSAMHLSKAQFYELIKGDAGMHYVKPFDTKTWSQTWDEFLFLARRWDDNQLINIFGKDDKTGCAKHLVSDPFEHWNNLTESDHKLIGDFIRRHHARFAHEIALHGIPGYKGTAFKLNEKLPAEHRDIAGLVARSHNLPVRNCVDYLKKYDATRRNYQNIHAVYLMTLLRVADIMQIHASRASSMVLKCREVVSPFSRNEFMAHHSVTNISPNSDDSEAIWVEAMPKNVAAFLKLKDWLSWIQHELDSSWAVLGEIYGSQEPLRHLGLSYRRVLSNLDNVEEFAKNEAVDYVPALIRFDVARAELLKLLIGPLYGDDPTYGVRELMQNGIDAVREYKQFIRDNPQYTTTSRVEQHADVLIELSPLDENGRAIMTISDKGIGMREDIISQYFLRAGASYRQNGLWKTAFESDNPNDVSHSKSKVLRSGRFGVGALAAFLIGNKIEVETRHITQSHGYSFSTTLDSEIIEVKRIHNAAVGTIIKIYTDSDNHVKLLENTYRHIRPSQWDWYCMDSPTVSRIYHNVEGVRIELPRLYNLELNNTDKWRLLKADQFPYLVYWTFDDAPALTCNGIFINDYPVTKISAEKELKKKKINKYYGSTSPEARDGDSVKFEVDSNIVLYPLISVLDPDAMFPLNLARTGIRVEDYPFGEDLKKDILTEMIAWYFYNGPSSLSDESAGNADFTRWLNLKGASSLSIACGQGYGIMCNALLDGFNISSIISFIGKKVEIDTASKDILIYGERIDGMINSSDIFNFRIVNNGIKVNSGDWTGRSIKFDGPGILEGIVYEEEVNRGKKNIREINFKKMKEKNGNIKLAIGDEMSNMYRLTYKLKSNNIGLGLDALLIKEDVYPAGSKIESLTKPWYIDELWQKYFGKSWLPFDLRDRISAFPETAKFFKENYPQILPK